MAKLIKTQKQVQVIARVQFKCDPRKVVYCVRSSDGKSEYQTFLFNGKACSCTCPATKPCYHMRQLEVLEQKRGLSLGMTVCAQVAQLVKGEYDAMERDYTAEQERIAAAPLNQRNIGWSLLRR